MTSIRSSTEQSSLNSSWAGGRTDGRQALCAFRKLLVLLLFALHAMLRADQPATLPP